MTFKFLLPVLALAVMAPSVVAKKPEPKAECKAEQKCCPQAQKPLAGHVVLIGLDGWGAYSVPQADMPNIKQKMAEGAYTLKKRSVLPSSSAMNWASMFDGCPVEIHGYLDNGIYVPIVPSRVVNERGVIPTIFSLMAEQRPEAVTACVFDWDGIKCVTDTAAITHMSLGPNYETYPDALTDTAVRYINTYKPELMMVLYDNPDHIGHQKGHDTPAYYAELNKLDSRVARVFQAVKDAGYYDDCIFIITADHGGIGTSHGGTSLHEMETPFIIAGKNVKTLGDFPESMMQYDVASTMAYILGLQQPQVWTGRPMTQVFK